MVIDTSAVVAIILGEPERAAFLSAVSASPRNIMSALTVYECRIVIATRTPPQLADFEAWLKDAEVEIVSFDAASAAAAFAAYSRYGKGSHAKAWLNLSDCAAYALARTLNTPLLFKGADFSHTDVTAAV